MGIQILKHHETNQKQITNYFDGSEIHLQGQVTPQPPLQIHFQRRVTALPAPKKLFLGVGQAATRP